MTSQSQNMAPKRPASKWQHPNVTYPISIISKIHHHKRQTYDTNDNPSIKFLQSV